MIRLILAMLYALGLALAPATASAGVAPMSDMTDCAIGGEMPDMPSDHSNKDSCTPACPAPSASAFLPSQNADSSGDLASKAKLVWALSKELVSVPSSGLDPPPRA